VIHVCALCECGILKWRYINSLSFFIFSFPVFYDSAAPAQPRSRENLGLFSLHDRKWPHKFRAPHYQEQFCGSSGRISRTVVHRYTAIQNRDVNTEQQLLSFWAT